MAIAHAQFGVADGETCVASMLIRPAQANHASRMRVGVYIDGFNLYFGGRGICGHGMAGWRWLDLRSLTSSLAGWPGAQLSRVVYCTAPISGADNPSGAAGQDVYLKALRASGSVDHIEYGV